MFVITHLRLILHVGDNQMPLRNDIALKSTRPSPRSKISSQPCRT